MSSLYWDQRLLRGAAQIHNNLTNSRTPLHSTSMLNLFILPIRYLFICQVKERNLNR